MPDFNFVLQYVSDPAASAKFYSELLGIPVVNSGPTFCMLPLRDGVMLGLWLRSDVKPEARSAPGGNEIGFAAANAATVDELHDDWVRRGVKMVQAPTRMDFGHTFVALDPDGQRLRVYSPATAD